MLLFWKRAIPIMLPPCQVEQIKLISISYINEWSRILTGSEQEVFNIPQARIFIDRNVG
jgi:hypothetical protein